MEAILRLTTLFTVIYKKEKESSIRTGEFYVVGISGSRIEPSDWHNIDVNTTLGVITGKIDQDKVAGLEEIASYLGDRSELRMTRSWYKYLGPLDTCITVDGLKDIVGRMVDLALSLVRKEWKVNATRAYRYANLNKNVVLMMEPLLLPLIAILGGRVEKHGWPKALQYTFRCMEKYGGVYIGIEMYKQHCPATDRDVGYVHKIMVQFGGWGFDSDFFWSLGKDSHGKELKILACQLLHAFRGREMFPRTFKKQIVYIEPSSRA
eukprot:GHVO01003645.1.p1 GENE.GHVO01003645.1~~GHVO01003645.1.p1  ORF type:complete len:292 (-),score=25.92 GHVO01003645.1:7-798(-)